MLLGVFICLVSSALFSLTDAWVYVLRGVHAHARVLCMPDFGCTNVLGVTYTCFLDARVGIGAQGSTTRMRMCCACLLLGARMCLVSPTLVYLTHTWVFVIRGVHVHARELRVPAFGCMHVLDVTYACFLGARVDLCA
jgi:hypothetical protein